MTRLEYRSNAIVDLMQSDDEQCGEEWLKKALQMALMLELATIPPYACGLWSIKDPVQDAEVYRAVREIMFDEMSHFAMVGNILSAIGGSPVLADPLKVPHYPGSLPGGVRPDLTVYLGKLDTDAACTFSKIEKPDAPLAFAAAQEEPRTSIGAFYSKIQRALSAQQHLFEKAQGPQLEADLSAHGAGNSIKPITDWKTANGAIEIIKQQGEGTSARPDNPFPTKPGELAHYYVFRELYRGRKLVQAPGGWDFTGAPVTMPTVYPMSRVPADGWAGDPQNAPAPRSGVAVILDDFNAHYSEMLRTFEEAWRTSNAGERLGRVKEAIKGMSSMRALARALVQIPLPGNAAATYGPEFRYTDRRP